MHGSLLLRILIFMVVILGTIGAIRGLKWLIHRKDKPPDDS